MARPGVGNDEFNSENPTLALLIVPVVTSTPLEPLLYYHARTFFCEITCYTPSTTHTLNPTKEKEKETQEDKRRGKKYKTIHNIIVTISLSIITIPQLYQHTYRPLQNSSVQGPLRECHSVLPSAWGLPFYFTPCVCIPDVIVRLTDTRNKKNRTMRGDIGPGHMKSELWTLNT